MKLQNAKVIEHKPYTDDYNIIRFNAPDIAVLSRPGQFIHLKVPNLDGRILRRPFSIYMADTETLSVLYKVVGVGTEMLTRVDESSFVNILGPLGNGFPQPDASKLPIFIAGGYGVAPLCFLAKKMRNKGIIFIGASTKKDVLFVDTFKSLGWNVVVSTNDGSLGFKGLVTESLNDWVSKELDSNIPELFACGPEGMMKAVSKIAKENNWTAWLSLDKHMGCGVGACLACVQKILENGKPVIKRVCKDGPVFESNVIIWE